MCDVTRSFCVSISGGIEESFVQDLLGGTSSFDEDGNPFQRESTTCRSGDARNLLDGKSLLTLEILVVDFRVDRSENALVRIVLLHRKALVS